MSIHIAAKPDEVADRILLPGDPLRAKYIAETFLEGAKAEAVEVVVQEDAPVTGLALMEAGLPRECLVCAYVRDGEVHIPNGSTVLQPGDQVILFIQTQFAKKVMKYFKGRE